MSKFASVVYKLYPDNPLNDKEIEYLKSLGKLVTVTAEPKFSRFSMLEMADFISEAGGKSDEENYYWDTVRIVSKVFPSIIKSFVSGNSNSLVITFNDVMYTVAGYFPVMEGKEQEVRSLFEEYLDSSLYDYSVYESNDPKCLYDCTYYLVWNAEKHNQYRGKSV